MNSHAKNNGASGTATVTHVVNLFSVLASPVLGLFGFAIFVWDNIFQKNNTQSIRQQKFLKGLGVLNRSKERVLDLTILNGGKYGN